MKGFEPYGFIYITTNNINGKKYIGQRKFSNGWKSYLGGGIHLKNAVKKYGKENFTRDIIAIGYCKDELNELENQYIDDSNAVNRSDFYNIASGGKAGNSYAGKTEEEMTEIRSKISEANIGKVFTEEHKKRLSEAMSGRVLSEETKQKLSEAHIGKYHSEEARDKMRIAKSGTNNPMYGKTGTNNPGARKIICITTGEVFDFMKEAGDKYSIDTGSITNCCKGRQNSAGKHPTTGKRMIWAYYEEWLKNEVIK